MAFATIQLPITEPVAVFGLTLLVIFIIPLVFSKLKLPGIIGLIISGMILGPSGLGFLNSSGSIELLGNVGLIYLMFLAGLELDAHRFINNRNKNIAFGLLTFAIPFAFGYFIVRYILNFNTIPALLIASMFSTQTLIAFPIVSRLRLTKILPVEMSIGGTIITDTLVLLIFVVITTIAGKPDNHYTLLLLIPKMLLFLLFVLLILPRITKWFLKNLSTDQMAQYVFVLSTVFTTSALARLMGIEPIIGSFLSGIILNRQIPYSSMLLNRLEFIGNALFIPIFLFFVGMLIDLKAFISGYESLKFSVILIGVALATKWLAAFIAQQIYKLTSIERQILFGLSSAHAAATIAIILVGYQIGLVDINVLNATIVVIFLSCMTSALVTERAAKRFAIANPTSKFKPADTDKILIPLANPSNIERLIELAENISEKAKKNPITLLSVLKDEDEMSKVHILAGKAEEISQNYNTQTEWAIRVDVNISSGIVRAAKELLISKIIMGWSGKYLSSNRWVFGSILEGVLAETKQPVYICSLKKPISQMTSIYILVPRNAEFDPDYKNCMHSLERLVRIARQKVVFLTDRVHAENVMAELPQSFTKFKPETVRYKRWEEAFELVSHVNGDALIVIISARKGTLGYSAEVQDTLQYTGRLVPDKNVIIIYPAIHGTSLIDSRSFISGTGRVVADS